MLLPILILSYDEPLTFIGLAKGLNTKYSEKIQIFILDNGSKKVNFDIIRKDLKDFKIPFNLY
jgi:hypothetical protein